MTSSAAIIGGGIGGLALATLLRRQNWHVDVFERAPGLPTTGTALGMWPAALTALDALGIGDHIRSVGSRQDHGEIRSADGRVLSRVDSSRGTAVLISRAPLLAALFRGAEPVVRFSTEVRDLDALSDYDIIVGSDGVNSRARTVVTGHDVRARHLGFSALVGSAPGTTSTVTETWGEGQIFGITPRDGDLTNWFAAYRQDPADPMPTDPLGFLTTHFGHWHRDVRDLLARVDPASFIHYHVKEMPRLRTFVNGNVAIIGDAGHAMAPNLGRGACETLVDAVTLGHCLVRHKGPEALHRYDRTRRPATQRLVTASRLVSKLALSTRLEIPRNLTLRAVSRFA